jgi:hypothetical protein
MHGFEASLVAHIPLRRIMVGLHDQQRLTVLKLHAREERLSNNLHSRTAKVSEIHKTTGSTL